MELIQKILSGAIALLIFFLLQTEVNAQGSDNNAFLFNGIDSRAYILDGDPLNPSTADQSGFQLFAYWWIHFY